MEHFRIEELLLYWSGQGLTQKHRQTIENHLKVCDHCRKQLSNPYLKKSLSMNQKNPACRECRDNLLSLVEGELDPTSSTELRTHIKQCSHCQKLYKWISDLPSWEEDTLAAINLPRKSKNRIESKVFTVLSEQHQKLKNRDSLSEMIRTKFYEIELIFSKMHPDVAFRGQERETIQTIEHPGGDILIKTGIKKLSLSLTSIFEEHKVKATTDDKGEIRLKNLKKGDYTIEAQGYILKAIKVKKQS